MNRRVITIKKNQQERKYFAGSVQQTAMLAHRIARSVHGGDVLALQGNLGAGKTTFTQFLARELGIKEQITSPTFVLMKISVLPKPVNGIERFCHIDAYRLESAGDLEAIGAQEYIGSPATLSIIEWPEKVEGCIPKNAIWISFMLDDRV